MSAMFSDLVSSTALSVRMDAEDVCAVISAYQKCVAQWFNALPGADDDTCGKVGIASAS